MNTLEKVEIYGRFGLTPEAIGCRHRGGWIVDEIEMDEDRVGAAIGDLYVEARDGGDNPIEADATWRPNFRGRVEAGTWQYDDFVPLALSADKRVS